MERTPEAFLAAIKMAPSRKNVFVEGSKDRLFLNWLAGKKKNPNCQIVEINFVKFSKRLEGNKEKIKYFANIIDDKYNNIKFFCDSDFDAFLSSDIPSCIINTDYNDIEGYLFNKKLIEKTIILGFQSEKINIDTLISTCLNFSIKVGVLRILSIKKEYFFSINATSISKFIRKKCDVINFNFDDWLKAVLQNSNHSLRDFAKIKNEHKILFSQLSSNSPNDLIRGKDVIEIFERIIKLWGYNSVNYDISLWSALDEHKLLNKSHPNLACIINFIQN